MVDKINFDSSWEYEEYIRGISIGPNLNPGLVLGQRNGVKSTWLKGGDFTVVEGLPVINLYILEGETSREGQKKIYNFLDVGFFAPFGLFSDDDEDFKYGEKHKLTLRSKRFSAGDLERDLSGNWVKNAEIRELEHGEFCKFLTFLCGPHGGELKDELKNRGINSLTWNSPYIDKVVQKRWDDFYD